MDQKRLPLFIAISFAILLLFQYLSPRKVAPPPVQHSVQTGTPSAATSPGAPGGPGTKTTPAPANAPRVAIDAPRVLGSISLLGARLDDLRLRDYHDTVAKNFAAGAHLGAPARPRAQQRAIRMEQHGRSQGAG